MDYKYCNPRLHDLVGILRCKPQLITYLFLWTYLFSHLLFFFFLFNCSFLVCIFFFFFSWLSWPASISTATCGARGLRIIKCCCCRWYLLDDRHVARRCRRWAHPPVIHTASHVDHKKRVAWVPISMHTCGYVSIIVLLRLVVLRAAGAPLLTFNSII